MTYPTPYEQSYSYTAFQQAQGDNGFPGTELDDDLANISQALSETQAFIKTTLRSDGQLQNGCVTLDKLSSDIQVGVPVPTVWAATTAYAEKVAVSNGSVLYYCLLAHTSSSSFASDLGAGLWRKIVDFSTLDVIPDGSVGTVGLADAAVTTAKLDDAAVTTAKLDDAAVTAAKLAPSVGVMPIGGITEYAGLTLPSGFLWCNGAAVARTGVYAALFAALTVAAIGTSTSGSPTLTGVSVDPTGYGLVGAVVEHAGFAAGVTIVSVTATTITLSANASSNSTSTLRVLPHGAGNGSTTFNVPERRGRGGIGRDDMGGTAASVLTTLAGVGQKGGEEKHALTIGELAAHSHSITDGGHDHGVTDPGHYHNIGHLMVAYAAGFGLVPNGATKDEPTSTATTGVTVNSATTDITINTTGSGTAHNNLPPVQVCNYIIFAGA